MIDRDQIIQVISSVEKKLKQKQDPDVDLQILATTFQSYLDEEEKGGCLSSAERTNVKGMREILNSAFFKGFPAELVKYKPQEDDEDSADLVNIVKELLVKVLVVELKHRRYN